MKRLLLLTLCLFFLCPLIYGQTQSSGNYVLWLKKSTDRRPDKYVLYYLTGISDSSISIKSVKKDYYYVNRKRRLLEPQEQFIRYEKIDYVYFRKKNRTGLLGGLIGTAVGAYLGHIIIEENKENYPKTSFMVPSGLEIGDAAIAVALTGLGAVIGSNIGKATVRIPINRHPKLSKQNRDRLEKFIDRR